jgi:hypothetical protein
MHVKHVVGGVLGAGVLAFGLTACGSSSPSGSGTSQTTAALTLSQWRTQAGPVLQSIASDLKALSQASSSNDVSAFGADAQNLANDVKRAQALPSAPDATVQGLWSTALASFSTTASEFQQAIQQQNQSLLQQGGEDLQKAGNQLLQFQSALQSAAASG